MYIKGKIVQCSSPNEYRACDIAGTRGALTPAGPFPFQRFQRGSFSEVDLELCRGPQSCLSWRRIYDVWWILCATKDDVSTQEGKYRYRTHGGEIFEFNSTAFAVAWLSTLFSFG